MSFERGNFRVRGDIIDIFPAGSDKAVRVELFGDEIAINCQVALLQGVSGHADKDGLMNWVKQFKQIPRQIFVNHGEDDAALPFARELSQSFGIKADVPYSGSEFDLLTGEWIFQAQPRLYQRKHSAAQPDKQNPAAFARLQDAARRLNDAVQSCKSFANRELQSLTDKIEAIIRNMKDENGDVLGYTADTIILPGNRPMAEAIDLAQ